MKSLPLLVGMVGLCTGGWFAMVAPALSESDAAAARLAPESTPQSAARLDAARIEEASRRLRPSAEARPAELTPVADGSLRGRLEWEDLPGVMRWICAQDRTVLRLQVRPETVIGNGSPDREVAEVTVIFAGGGR